jgi:hypothetical protein
LFLVPEGELFCVWHGRITQKIWNLMWCLYTFTHLIVSLYVTCV